MALKVDEIRSRFDSAYAEKAHKKANIYLNQLLQIDPNNAELLKLKLGVLTQLGSLTENLGFLRKLCWYRSSDPECFEVLSQVYYNQGQYPLCVLAACYCLSLGDNPISRERLALALSKLDKTSVKIYFLKTDRIGHLTCEPDSWLRSRDPKDTDTLHLFVSNGTTCNVFVYELLQRYMTVCESDFFYRLHFTRQHLLSDEFYQAMPYDNSDVARSGEDHDALAGRLIEAYRSSAAVIQLSAEDREQGRAELSSLTSSDAVKIVCFHVRDAAYLQHSLPGIDTTYHDYRDSNIESMAPAVRHLLDLGYLVVRIGKVSNQHLSFDEPNYLDLTLHTNASSLLETYLIEQCEFFIGTSSGPVGTAALFNKAILEINACPFLHAYFNHSRKLPKLISQNGEILSFIDVAAGLTVAGKGSEEIRSCFDGATLDKNLIAYHENTADEILDAVKEVILAISCFGSLEQSELSASQIAYLEKVPKDHVLFSNEAVVCDSFLNKYKDLF